jgi:hypothetical protein
MTSRVETLYTGLQITPGLEIFVSALGNRRIYERGRGPQSNSGRITVCVAISAETTEATRSRLSLASTVPARRLELRLGKMSAVDFFDLNYVPSQFMNWAIVNNGLDHAADARGYTYRAVMEYYSRNWAARFGEMLMPTVANGIDLDWNIARCGENFEVEYRRAFIPTHAGVVRALGFVNHANMDSPPRPSTGFFPAETRLQT